MKKTIFWMGAFLLIAPFVFSQANSGDYKVVTVKSGENINTISAKYLKSRRFKSDLLRYNHISASKIKAGMKLKIPFNISKDRAAKIKFLRGTVFRKTARSGWKRIRRAGIVLLQYDRIKTGKASKAEIQFDDGSQMQIASNSVISLKEYAYSKKKGRNANINLKGGSLFANVNKLRRNSNFKVSTVTAVAGVRGTQFYVAIDKNEEVKVEVYKGKVDVSAHNQKVSVKANQETIVTKGSGPKRPKKILNPRRIRWAR